MSVKGFTYEISQEEGIFSFAADAGENTNVWFKKYSTPSAFEAEEAEYGSSWSWMGQPGAIEAPNSGSLNPETGAKISVHQIPDGTTQPAFSAPFPSSGNNGPRNIAWSGEYIFLGQDVADNDAANIYKMTKDGTQKDAFGVQDNTIGLTWDGQYLWLTEFNQGFVYQLDTSGVETGNKFDTGLGASVRGLAWDGSYFYIGTFSDAFYKFKTDGTQVNKFNAPNNLDTRGLSFDGKYFYTGGEASDNNLYRYDKEFNEVESFSTDTGVNSGSVTWDGNYLWMISKSANFIYRVTKSSGTDISYRVNSIT